MTEITRSRPLSRPLGRRRLFAASVILALAAGHTALWLTASAQLESGFADWVALRRQQGWSVGFAPPARGGWPFAATLSVPDMVLSTPSIASSRPGWNMLVWHAEHVVLHVELVRPRSLLITPEGQQSLRLGDRPDIPFTADRVQADVPLEPGIPTRAAELRIDHLRAGLPTGALTVTRLQAQGQFHPAAPQGEAVATFNVSAGDIGLPPPNGLSGGEGAWPLGARVASLVLDGALDGPLPRSRSLYARASGWRDGGGTLELRRVSLGWGPLGLSGSATMALDDQMQPMGTATARIVGHDAVLDALAAGHVLPPRTATAAKAVLGLLARTPQGGGTPEVEVPLTLQGSGLSLGRIPLARIPELVWPDAP
jgi:hypothetical protein